MASVITLFVRITWLLPEALVLSSLFVVGIAGILAGFFLRVPAILAATAAVAVFAIATSVSGNHSAANTVISVLLHAGVLQAAYLATLAVASLWTRSRARHR